MDIIKMGKCTYPHRQFLTPALTSSGRKSTNSLSLGAHVHTKAHCDYGGFPKPLKHMFPVTDTVSDREHHALPKCADVHSKPR